MHLRDLSLKNKGNELR